MAAFGGSVADWPAFPDSAAALARLQSRFKLGVITNCDDDLFAASEARLGIDFDWVVTAQQAKRYKPNPRGFELAFERIGLPPSRILHVAQSLYHDHVTAKRLGPLDRVGRSARRSARLRRDPAREREAGPDRARHGDARLVGGPGVSADVTRRPGEAGKPTGDDPLRETLVSSEVIRQGRILDFRIDTIETADGHRSTRDIAGHPGGVCMVAIDDEDRVLLVRQWRHATNGPLLEIPAGTLDREPDGSIEEHAVAARRELEEETGSRAATGATSAGSTRRRASRAS